MSSRFRFLSLSVPAVLALLLAFAAAEILVGSQQASDKIGIEHQYDPVADAVVSWTLRPGQSVAQSFVSESREVRMTGFRMKALRLGNPRDLEYSVADASTGRQVETGKITAEQVSPFFEGWIGADFPSVQRLKPGTRYEIRLQLSPGGQAGGYEVFGTATDRIDAPDFNVRFQYVASWGETGELTEFENPLNLDYGCRTPAYAGGVASVNGSRHERLDFAFRILEQGTVPDTTEEPFAFVRDINSPLHTISLRDESVRPGRDEVALNSGWVLLYPGRPSEVIKTAVDDFSQYLSLTLKTPVKARAVSRGEAPGARSILLGTAADLKSVPADLDRSEAFLVDSSDGDRIRVHGFDDKGVMRGLQYLEDTMSVRRSPVIPRVKAVHKPRYSPRLTCTPYYAKSELEMEIDPYTDNFLSRISHAGFSGIWIWGELMRVGRSEVYPELKEKVAERQARLREIAARAARHGLDIYVYLGSQPLPAAFFERHPGVKGTPIKAYGGDFVLCTTPEESRRYITEATTDLMRQVPAIKGLVCIVGVEGFLHCHSRGNVECPRCSRREPEDVIAEFSRAVLEGARAGNSNAEVAIWPYSATNAWSKHDKLQSRLIEKLPAGITWLAEFDKEGDVSFGGITIPAYDYSISFIGPSERFGKQYDLAVGRKLPFWVKTEHAISLEFVQTPYIPVFYNWVERYTRLREFESVTGFFANWQHYGFMPSIAAEICKWGTWMPSVEPDEFLRQTASREFGAGAASEALKAWRIWSSAFQEYPFSGNMALGVIQKGPAHPFFMDSKYQPRQASGRQFKNDLSWTRPWGPDLALRQLQKVENGWSEGMGHWENVIRDADARLRPAAIREKGIAQAILACLRSTIHLGQFYELRDRLEKETRPKEAIAILDAMQEILKAELKNSREALAVVELDSRLGYANSGKGEQIGVPRAGIYSAGSISKKIAQVERLLAEDFPRYRQRYRQTD
jgi:hypothetical protein